MTSEVAVPTKPARTEEHRRALGRFRAGRPGFGWVFTAPAVALFALFFAYPAAPVVRRQHPAASAATQSQPISTIHRKRDRFRKRHCSHPSVAEIRLRWRN